MRWFGARGCTLYPQRRCELCSSYVALQKHGCLHLSLLTVRCVLPQMRDVGLLVFDEAHHCKSDHPYNQLLQDFYHCLEPQQRPQVTRLLCCATA